MQTKPSTMSRRKGRELEECSSTRRVSKATENEVVDIISHLPEEILHHIFSLVDMKQTIQTCILSRRWRYFWVSLPTLNFSYNNGSNRKAIKNAFMDFVDRVLMFRSSSSIDEFTLVTNDSIDVTDRLNTWILASVIRNVQQLTIHTEIPKKFQFHHSLLTCKSLTKLVMRGICVSLGLLDEISLPRLKTLSLHSVQFEHEDSTNQLFSSCPVLESLALIWCVFPHINVNISSPKLQHLVIKRCSRNHPSNALDLGPDFQLCAPNLISFYWCNNMSIQCDPKNLSSLVKAVVKVTLSTVVREDSKLSKEALVHAPFMVNILRGLHNVEDLTLSASFLEVLYGVPDLLEVQPTHCCNLKCLKMKTLLSRDCIYAIAYFLKISPKIENLSFILYTSDQMFPYWNPDEVTSNSAKRGDCWKAGLSLEGLLNQVKCLKLRDLTGLINELEFIEILLKNAMLLEELLVFFEVPYGPSYPYDYKERELKERRLAKFREKVLTFPKASSNVVIIFKYVKY